MAPILSNLEKIAEALAEARVNYGKSNPNSSQIHKESIGTLPGGMCLQN